MNMEPRDVIDLTRRDFLVSAARGVGGLAFASLLAQDGLLAANAEKNSTEFNPLAPKPPHFAPKAKQCIFIYMEGGVSQLDLFDPKPKLNELNGQKLPDSMTKNIRFAFLQKDSATLLGSPYPFQRYGKCGTEMSGMLPHIGACADDIALVRSMHTEAFNHHPGELLMYTGFQNFGRPSVGSWVSYALGSASQNLPGYVVLTAGRAASGGNTMFSSGFLPSVYQGVPFRNEGEPVMDLNNPAGVTAEMRHYGLDALRDLNSMRQKVVGDPEIASRIASYELAARMQLSAPELTDFSGEKAETLEAYGVNRDPGKFTKDPARRRSGLVQDLQPQLPDGPPARRTRRALREHSSRVVGSSQRYRSGLAVQLRGGRSAGRRTAPGFEATWPARQHARRVGFGIWPHAARRESPRVQGPGQWTRSSSLCVQRLDGRRRRARRAGHWRNG